MSSFERTSSSVSEIEGVPTSTIVIHFIGAPEQAALEDDIVNYLTTSGWRTLGMTKEGVEKIADRWDDQKGVTFSGITTDRAHRLLSNIQTIFGSRTQYLKMTASENTSHLKVSEMRVEDMPEDIQLWHKSMQQRIAEGDIETIVNTFCQMGVEDPHHCECEAYGRQGDYADWLHDNHIGYNTIMWKLLSDTGMIESLHAEVFAESQRTDNMRVFTDPVDAKKLADNFLKKNPNSEWVAV